MQSIRRSLGVFAATAVAAALATTGVAAASPGPAHGDHHRQPPHHFRPPHHQPPQHHQPPPHHPSPPPHFPPPPPRGPEGAVFVQTDNLAGNSVVAYGRESDGTLVEEGSYPTAGLGGQLEGSEVDHLASQGSLTLDAQNHLLYAVNAGSNTITVFGVDGDRLQREQVLPSGGEFPVSVTVHGNLVYVLNARGGGSIQGYVQYGGQLTAVASWNRALGLDPTATPEFTHTPGQVAFTPDGSRLLVTTKGNTSSVDVFGVDHYGTPSATPVVTPLPGAVPFAVDFDAAGKVLVTEAGTNSVASFTIAPSGTLTPVATVATGGEATCWIAGVGPYVYASNAGSADLSGFLDGSTLSPLGDTATHGGTVDAASVGRFLYVQTGAAGIVDEFQVEAGGSLTPLGSVTVPNAVGGEGITAS
jgi:6-phosphogluconolactonase (cycloisomerase 2 family)